MNNTARLAGAAIYANDMSRCQWIGGLNLTDINIFQIPFEDGSPFYLENNTISQEAIESNPVKNQSLATDADSLTTMTRVSTVIKVYCMCVYMPHSQCTVHIYTVY